MDANVLLGGSLLAIGLGVYETIRLRKDKRFELDKARLAHATVYAVGILLWPLLLRVLSISTDTPLELAMVVWPPILLLVNLLLSASRKQDGGERFNDLKSNAAVIVGAAWTASMLIRGSSSSKPANLLLLALVLCIVFITPSPDFDRNGYNGAVVTSAQNVVLTYALGVFIIAIHLSYKVGLE